MTSPAAAPSIFGKTARGAVWVFIWRMGTRTLGLASTVILVRILLPADFGLIALATTFAQSVDALGWLGIEDALVREKHPTRDTYDTAFTLSALRGLLMAALIAALAVPAARFFAEPRLAAVVLALAAGTLVSSLANVGVAEFRRSFNFELELRLWLVPRLLSTTAAISCAVICRSYWALIVGILTSQGLRVVFSYVMHPFRPRLALKDWRNLTSYSFWTWIYGLCCMVAGQSDTFMIGRLLNTSSVGFYAIGTELAYLPSTELIEPLTRSSFSAFAEDRRHGGLGGQIWLRIAGVAALIVVPAGVGISLVADSLVRVVFGPAWGVSAGVVQILGLAATTIVFGSISTCLFQAFGNLRLMVGVKAIAIVLRLGLLAALVAPFGLTGAALAIAISLVAEQLILSGAALRAMGVPARAVAAMLWRCVAATLVMAGVLGLSGLGWRHDATDADMHARLFGVSLCGAVVYAAALAALWLACRRPAGPEADGVAMLAHGMGSLRDRVARVWPSAARANHS